MKHLANMARLEHPAMAPVLERQFLSLYSRWHETHDQSLQKRLFMSLNQLLRREPGFDFRERLWRAL